MKLVVDIDKVKSNLTGLSTNVDSFSSEVSAFNGASVDCSLEEVSDLLNNYKSSIGEELSKINNGSNQYVKLVDECCSEYKANEENTQTLNIEDIEKIISDCSEITMDYKGNAASKLTGLPSTELNAAGFVSVVHNGNYLMLKFNENDISKIFGSQLDSKGSSRYGYDSSGCDDYARGYCLYIQTGKVPSKASVGVGGNGLASKQISAGNRKEQAQIAYDLLQKGKPSVIHLNSPSTGSGRGHWVTVVGVRKGVNRDSVKVGDLIILDPVTGTVRSTTEDKEYLRNDTGRCSCEPGYHINYFA